MKNLHNFVETKLSFMHRNKTKKIEQTKPQNTEHENRGKVIGGIFFVVVALGVLGIVIYRSFFPAAISNVTLPLNDVAESSSEDTNTVSSIVATSTPAIKILDTPTGWLNVRSGPGTTFEQVARIFPGETYPLEDEDGEWYHITITEDVSGWIFGLYGEIISEE